MEKPHALTGRKQSPEHVAKRTKKCEPGCTCKRHTSQQTPEAREKQRQATLKKWESGLYEGRSDKTATTRAAWSDEKRDEVSRNMSEARKKEWAEKGPDRNSVPGHLRGRVSEQEMALAPYLERFGFQHNNADSDDRKTWIGRRVPDYVNLFDRKLFEYFGVRHHDPEEEQERIAYYAAKGWSCTVLWEYDLLTWLEEHRHLVTEEEHQRAWKAALCKRSRAAAEKAIQQEIIKRAAWKTQQPL